MYFVNFRILKGAYTDFPALRCGSDICDNNALCSALCADLINECKHGACAAFYVYLINDNKALVRPCQINRIVS